MTRYSTIAIVLHWLIAALLLGELYVGFTMAGMERTPARVPWINWHKTLGIAILLLTLARLGCRPTIRAGKSFCLAPRMRRFTRFYWLYHSLAGPRSAAGAAGK